MEFIVACGFPLATQKTRCKKNQHGFSKHFLSARYVVVGIHDTHDQHGTKTQKRHNIAPRVVVSVATLTFWSDLVVEILLGFSGMVFCFTRTLVKNAPFILGS